MSEIKSKVWKWAKDTLTYVRINDEKGRLSLTNIAMMVVIWKLIETDTSTFKDITALAVALLGYQSKRLIDKKPDTATVKKPKRRLTKRKVTQQDLGK